MISLLPLITEFDCSGKSDMALEGLQQVKRAESFHQQDSGDFIHQWAPQPKGWDLQLVALEAEDGYKGYITGAEYDIIMAAKDIPQVLTIIHPEAPDGVQVVIPVGGLALRPVWGTIDHTDDSHYVGTITLRII